MHVRFRATQSEVFPVLVRSKKYTLIAKPLSDFAVLGAPPVISLATVLQCHMIRVGLAGGHGNSELADIHRFRDRSLVVARVGFGLRI